MVDPAAGGKPGFNLFNVACIPHFKVRMADSLAAGQQAIGKLLGIEMHIAIQLLEPFHAIARRTLQFKRLDFAFLLIATQS